MEVMRMEEMAGRQGQHDRKRLLTAKVDSQMQEETRAALSHIIELHKKQRSEVCVSPRSPRHGSGSRHRRFCLPSFRRGFGRCCGACNGPVALLVHAHLTHPLSVLLSLQVQEAEL